MTTQKPIASLSLDVDNKWSYLKTHGDPGWEEFPSFLETVVPRVLKFLSQRNLKITFFLVGQDAALEKNRDALRAIAMEGHEIGNHSFSHEPWLHLYAADKIENEIATAEEQIVRVTGQRPVGFRGPGFSFSDATLAVLAQRGYLYDASTLPTYLGPLSRIYYFFGSNLSVEEQKLRSLLFGSVWNGLRPLKIHRCRVEGELLEIPVTTMPVVRLPIHFSYLLYISRFSTGLALAYFRAALALCRVAGVFPSLLLHPLDFLGEDDKVGLDFFPGMKLSTDHKLAVVAEALKIYSEGFQIVTLKEHALQFTEVSRATTSTALHRATEPSSSPRTDL